MIGRREHGESGAAAQEPAVLTGLLAEAVKAIRPGDASAVEQVVDVLLRLGRLGDHAVARGALRLFAARPRVVVRLDERVRRILWLAEPLAAAIGLAVGQLAGGAAGPAGLVLASIHRDGRIRERAVAGMLTAPDPVWLPFLVVRAADWAGPVRDRARYGLAVLLANQPAIYLPAALPMAVAARAWWRGGFAYAQTLAALFTATPQLRDQLLATGGVEQRRFLLELGLAHGWWSAEGVLGLAKAGDVRVRAKAAEAVCRQAVWSDRVAALRRLARHPRTEVREQALVGLTRLGRQAEVAAYLDDPAPLVRALARAAARQAGIDVVDHYRRVVATPDPAESAIAGLAEVGTATADVDVLSKLLTHPRPSIRAQAVRALHHLDALPVERVAGLLRDPAPAVVREATTALRLRTNSVPTDLALQLLTDPDRVDLRRAGYRLLRVRGLVEQLRAALLLITDPDADLSRRAVADVTRLARDAASPSWRRHHQPTTDATPAQTTELIRLSTIAADTLGAETTRMLHTWLTRPST